MRIEVIQDKNAIDMDSLRVVIIDETPISGDYVVNERTTLKDVTGKIEETKSFTTLGTLKEEINEKNKSISSLQDKIVSVQNEINETQSKIDIITPEVQKVFDSMPKDTPVDVPPVVTPPIDIPTTELPVNP